ncbi:hypothetical protein [Roseateles chitinivorans]|uniref:hypothetical protein n=1 Tax=Roseateles chitinivorans TaxID=2917965 RepID=UPI003D672B02
MADVRDALGGTDLQVFDALGRGDYAAADAYRMRDAVDEARVDGDADAVHTAIERYTGAPQEGDWRAAQEMDADTRREEVVRALGGIVSDADVARGLEPGQDLSTMSAEDRAVAYVSRDIDVYVGGGPEGEGQVVTRRLEGANRDLAGALLRHGESSVEARAARLGVEMQRTGDPPNAINIDRATFDPRFQANLAGASPAEIAAHRRAAEDRARVVMLAAERYANGPPRPEDHEPATDPADPNAAMNETRVTEARDRLIQQFDGRFGSDTTGARLAAGLLTDARPTPETAALAMEHAMDGAGTNEELLFRFTERMDRDEIAAMRTAYARNTHRSLDADLGTFGEGFLGEVSGDDRLRMERAMLGSPRNDRERLEVAAFAIEQQRRESSGFGAWLADGTLAAEAMSSTEAELRTLAGGPIGFGRRGEVIGVASSGNFDASGRYIGGDADSFAATTSAAQRIAETYSRRIDAFADVATTGIAILGAIAAAVITVATGGAAAPLIAAAIVTGLASMSANYAIKGGRYGWEQAAVDLGMTAVQAVTAGVGAQLGAAAQVASKGAAAASTASRTLASLSRLFTGNPVVDQIIIGAVTGSIGGVANAGFDERTWEHGAGNAVESLFGGLIKGGLSGAASAALTNSVEALGRNGAAIADRARAFAAQGGLARGAIGLAGRGIGGIGRGLGAAVNMSTEGGGMRAVGAMAARGLAKGTISGLGGMAGRGTEIAVDAATGRYHGDAGDALLEIGQAGAHSFVQGIGEGAGEAVGATLHSRRTAALGEAINRERDAIGEPRLSGDALEAATQDLMFMNQVGEGGALGRAIHLDHVAANGGLEIRPPSRAAAAAESPHALARTNSGDEHAGAAPRPVDEAAAPAARPTAMPTAEAAAEIAARMARTSAHESMEAQAQPSRPAAADAAETATAPAATRAADAEPHAVPRAGSDTGTETHAAAQPDAGAEPHPGTRSGATVEAAEAGTSRRTGDTPDAHAEAAAEAGGPPSRGGHDGGDGDGGDGGPRGPRGPGGEGESDRLFPGLTDAEVDAAFAALETGPLLRVGVDQPGADTRARPPAPDSEATLTQRQRAGALHEEANGLSAKADERLDRAIVREADAARAEASGNPRRAAALRAESDRLVNEAIDLQNRAIGLRAEAAEFASGRRSATADLPGADDVDTLFAGMRPEGPGLVRVPLSDVERNPALLQRMIRPMLEGEGGGRMVFRVESERGRSLVHVDAAGNVTIDGGASAHLNFGSFERAVEFVMQNSQGNARIIAFEVDEGWVRSVRSAAIPEFGTVDLHGQPRLVDVRFADDQLEIPSGLIGELNRFVKPGSGVVHELPRGTPPTSGDPSPGAPPGAPPGTPPGMSPHAPTGTGTGTGTAPRSTPSSEEAHAARLLGGDDAPAAQARAQADAPSSTRASPHVDDAGFSTTAAAIPGSDFHGDNRGVIKRGGSTALSEAPLAMQRLIGPGGQFDGIVVPTRRDADVLRVPKHGGGELEVTIRVGTLEPNADGLTPVARYVERPGTNRVEIIVSAHAPSHHVERALAHELNELRFIGHQRDDALRPGSRPMPPPDANKQMSRHDRGRMGELEHLARRIEAAGSPPAPERAREVASLHDEASRLVAHLGLVHGGDAADARRALALSALEPGSAARRLLGPMVEAARTNPMLEPMTGTLDDLHVLARQMDYQRAQDLPRARGTAHPVETAARRLIEHDLVRNGGRTVDVERLAQARAQLPDDASRALFDLAVERARTDGHALERSIAKARFEPPDRVARELAEQRFGDHVNYQDFELFRSRYLAANPSRNGNEPGIHQELFQRWVAGAFVTHAGGVARISIGLIRAEAVDIATPGLGLHADPIQQAVAKAQADAMTERDNIQRELAGLSPPSGRTVEQLEADLSAARRTIRDAGEALGTSAAQHFADQHLSLGGTPIPCSRTGAGVPDLAFNGPGGQLVIIEAKGPQASLITRRTVDGRRAEQGTPEYLESLARDMMKPSCPADVQALGNRLLTALRASPPQVDYYVVRQPLDARGRPAPLEAQKFDLTTGRAVVAGATVTGSTSSSGTGSSSGSGSGTPP